MLRHTIYLVAVAIIICITSMQICSVCLSAEERAQNMQEGYPPTSGADDYYRWLDSCIVGLGKDMPQISKSAEEAAGKFVLEDYQIAVWGDPSLICEFTYRAGGLMPTGNLKSDETHLEKHIVLMPLRDNRLQADINQAVEFRKQGNMVIAFARGPIIERMALSGVELDAAIDNHAAEHGGLFQNSEGIWVVSTDVVANIATLWTWTGEFVGACTRLGKMPTMFQSVRVPDSSKRNDLYLKKRYHDGTPTPVSAGIVGQDYLKKLRDSVMRMYADERLDIQSAAKIALGTRDKGDSLYLLPFGHVLQEQLGCPHDTGYFQHINKGWSDVRPDVVLKHGDLILVVGYDDTFRSKEYHGSTGFGTLLKKARSKNIRILWSLASYDKDAMASILEAERTLFIDQHWALGDALVQLPGYDVKILPPSGVLAETILWMINAEMLCSTK